MKTINSIKILLSFAINDVIGLLFSLPPCVHCALACTKSSRNMDYNLYILFSRLSVDGVGGNTQLTLTKLLHHSPHDRLSCE